MKYFLALILFFVSISSANAALSPEIKNAIDEAYKTKNDYVLDVVLKAAKKDSKQPELVDIYLTSLKQQKTKIMPKAKVAAQNEWQISGNVEAALSIANGNTKTADGSLKTKLEAKKGKWANTFKASAKNTQENRIRTDEEYQVNNQLRYSIDDKDYVFGELEYVNDRFSGYEYRVSEALGYGRRLYDNHDIEIFSELSAGSRQSSLPDGTKEQSLLGRARLKGSWQINDNLEFLQDISSSFASDAVISESDSTLKSKITDSLYLKVNYNIEHTDDVPANTKHIDTTTTVGVGYEF